MEPGEDSESRLARGQRAFDQGDYALARRLLEPLRDREGEIGTSARELLDSLAPGRAMLWVGAVGAVVFAVLFGYYVLAR